MSGGGRGSGVGGQGPDQGLPLTPNPASGASLSPEAINPDIKYVGPGPEGCHCGECGNLGGVRIEGVDPASGRRGGQTLYFCTLSGQAKRATWPACANFVKPSAISRQPSGDGAVLTEAES